MNKDSDSLFNIIFLNNEGHYDKGKMIRYGSLSLLIFCVSVIGSVLATRPLPQPSPVLRTQVVNPTLQPTVLAAETSIRPTHTITPTPSRAVVSATPTATPIQSIMPTTTPVFSDGSFGIKVINTAGMVQRGEYASETIATEFGATCSIEVDYASGPSTAKGLGTQSTDQNGEITWTWKVGTNTTLGTWPINISCALNGQTKQIEDNFTVQ